MMRMVHGIMRDLEAEERAYKKRSAEICKAAEALQRNELYRIIGQNEFESDEFRTAEDKALEFLGRR